MALKWGRTKKRAQLDRLGSREPLSTMDLKFPPSCARLSRYSTYLCRCPCSEQSESGRLPPETQQRASRYVALGERL